MINLKQTIHFTKMQGLGNDFIVIDGITQQLNNLNLANLAVNLCSRNFGIGGDGLVIIEKSEIADLKMRIINADGSEPEMCGNGLRCFAKFVYDSKLIEKEVFSVETLAGIMIPAIITNNNEIIEVEVDMGQPELAANKIPIKLTDKETYINEPITIDNKTYYINCISMGNPHCVIFVANLKEINLKEEGFKIENLEFFPEKTNVEFCQILSPNEIAIKVWERGAGETLACGTGACAAVVAAVLNNKLTRKATAHLPGGELKIEWQETNKHVIMTGPAKTVFKGEIAIY